MRPEKVRQTRKKSEQTRKKSEFAGSQKRRKPLLHKAFLAVLARAREKTRKNRIKTSKKARCRNPACGQLSALLACQGTGHPCGVPPPLRGGSPSPYRGPHWGPQYAPLRPTACAASPCVSPLRPPSGGNESPSVVRGVGHTGLRPFFPSPLPGAWPLRFSVKGSRFAPKSSPVRCSGLRPCAPLRLPVSPLTLPLRSTAGKTNSRQQVKTARSGVFWAWWYIGYG